MISSLVNSFLYFLSFFGFFLLVYYFIDNVYKKSISALLKNQSDFDIQIFKFGITYFLSLGLRGLLSSWTYYLGIHAQWALLGSSIIGILGWILTWRSFSKWRRDVQRALSGIRFDALQISEKWALLFLASFFLLLLYRVGVPWYYDHDEMAVYGFLSKQMGNGITYPDVLRIWGETFHSGPKLVETLDAQLFLITHDTYAIRFTRVLNFLFLSIFIINRHDNR